MSKASLGWIIALLVIFGGFMTWLNDRHEKIYDELLESCPKPAVIEPRQEVFYFAANTPISRTVMVRE